MSKFKLLFALSGLAAFAAASAANAEFLLTSKSMSDGGPLPASAVFEGFGCTGGNKSPDLAWSGAPQGTKSFALTVHDPDAPTGSGWWHWTLFDLPAATSGLPENASAAGQLPEGAREGPTDYGRNGFGGACPPKGDKAHSYVFTLYALPVESIGLDKTAPAAMISYFARAQAIGSASLTAHYGRD
ncbi:MAG: YbhB/YbcL family Raf kinase inhibitor-like protein [Hyphomicrobiales bacterium]